MSTCIIFGAADFDHLAAPIVPGDYIIAADGGLRHTQSLGLTPDTILGDFDSLGYIPENAVVHPVEKDDTDAMLAARLGLQKGFTEFCLYGGMDGKRLDHTIANFQTLQFLADHGARGCLIGKDYIACVIKNGELTFPQDREGDFSLFCMGPDAHGVSISGLYYEVQNTTLTAGFPLGVSNHFTGRPVRIRVEDGSLLALWERRAGFPQKG